MQAPTTDLGRLVVSPVHLAHPTLSLPRPIDSRGSESLLATEVSTSRLGSGALFMAGSLLVVWGVIALLALLETI